MSQRQKHTTAYFCVKYCAELGAGDFLFYFITDHWHELGSVTLFPGFQFHHLLNKEFVVETSRDPSSKLRDLVGSRESCDIPIVFEQIIPLFRKDFLRTKLYPSTKAPFEDLLLFKAPLVTWNLVS